MTAFASTLTLNRRQFTKAMAATAIALGASGLLATRTNAQASNAAEQTWTCDVLVIGAGAAGLAAAVEASQAGCSTMLIEKEGWMAGSSSLAQGGLYGAGTKVQAAAGVDDTAEAFYDYLLSRGGDKLDADLQRWCSEHFGETIDWMTDEMGIAMQPEVVIRSVDTVPRRHQVASTSQDACDALYDRAVEEGCDFRFGCAATALTVDDTGAVTGVLATWEGPDGNQIPVQIDAQKTIIATGGFCRNDEMVAKYCPDYAGVYSEVGIGCTGEGLQMGLEIGADYIGHGGTNGILACPVEPGQSKLIAKDALWITSSGERFTNEGGQTHDIYYTVARFDDQAFYAVYDQTKVDGLNDELRAKFDRGLAQGYISQGETVEEAAAAFGIDGPTVSQTLADYNALCRNGEDTAFGKKPEQLVELASAPYYLIQLGVCTHGSFGGYNVNSSIEVLDTEGQPIPNLYGAGEVSCGSFIYDDYPGGGCGLSWAFTSGRWAGINAAASIAQPAENPTPNDGDEPTTADWQAEREAPRSMTSDMAFDPHNGRHGAIPCATCHDAEPEPELFCGTCHNDADVPEGWA